MPPTRTDPILMNDDEQWPSLPLEAWRSTRDTLHMWTQIAGKLKVELAPFQNQLWHTALLLTTRGLTTGPLPVKRDSAQVQADFDFLDHQFVLATSDGRWKSLPLYPRSVADFYREVTACLAALGVDVQINPRPQEIPDPIPFPEDSLHDSYDADAARRWWRIMSASAGVMARHRSWFTGKASPVHFFWGSFDLTATRHSGRPHSVPPGSGYLFRTSENEENWAGGFWPGGGAIDYPAYYAYVVPKPNGLEAARIEPEEAFWSAELGEFLLPYDAVRRAPDPEATLLAFLQSTYVAGADLAGWDRARLEIAEIPRPR